MKISELIRELQKVQAAEGDIEFLGKDREPLSYVDVEDAGGRRIYTAALLKTKVATHGG